MSEPLALYIHWPFCRAKCPYCDFNSHVRERIDQAAWRDALRRELAGEAARANGTGMRRPLASIFFGGGTPSLMDPATVAALIEDAQSLFAAPEGLEVTLEANPTSVEAAKLRDFRAAGVNRLSLGVQALDGAALRFLGRQHDAGEAVAALELARATFPRLSFDLIYARPGQAEAPWREELRRALALAADHLSLYQLTIEPGTRFATEHARGAFALPEDDEAARLYYATIEEAARFDLRPYEVSNYAKPGAESRHNLVYWRYGDYLGIGPGAHQRLWLDGALLAARRHRAPEEWLARVARDGHARTEEVALAPEDRAREALLMGLRLAEGVDPARLAARSGLTLAEAVDPAMLLACLEEGYLEWRADGRLAATGEGRMRLDAMLPVLLR
ncbi:radical SAM family heme chaperone HemW [Paracraurococcus lichenis]|uniref:Heme chaperone HemW n=1 Tax=Paracraurococcus lichenis TaxID=3064888 RepID=A0ABT9E442_9PROT|nr:radical SAM family heme chaperone HemW [Paracraurococcus sp. LOR1-02]MDO9710946.1 radical SAM family heme chaperone HemW [Paracraurococcus sp. LOR1-02]